DYDTFGTLHRFSPIITGYTTEPVSTTRMAQHACQRAHAPCGRAPRSNRLDLSWQSPGAPRCDRRLQSVPDRARAAVVACIVERLIGFSCHLHHLPRE